MSVQTPHAVQTSREIIVDGNYKCVPECVVVPHQPDAMATLRVIEQYVIATLRGGALDDG